MKQLTYLNQLIDDARNRANIPTDNNLATVLSIPNGWISEYRKEPPKRHPSVEIATKLAILSGRREMEVIAHIELMTAKSEERKQFWSQYIENRGIHACLTITALALTIALSPEPAEASVLHLQNYDAHQSNFLPTDIYIMRTSYLPG